MEKYLFKFVICNVITLALSISVYGQAQNENQENDLLTLNANEKLITSDKGDNPEEVKSVSIDGFLEEYANEFNINTSTEMQEALIMVAIKSKLMDRKMDLINQKMVASLEFMYKIRSTKKDVKEYVDNMEKLDSAIADTHSKILEIDALMSGIRKRN